MCVHFLFTYNLLNLMLTFKKLFYLLLVGLILAFSGCEKDDEISVQRIEFATTAINLLVGESVAVEMMHYPADAPAPDYEWVSSDPSVVHVDVNGRINAVQMGGVVLTARTGNGLAAECYVTILPVDAKGIVVDVPEVSILLGEVVTIGYSFDPDTATFRTLTWEMLDNSIAEVSDGQVRGLAVGETTLVLKQADNNLQAVVKIKVLPIPVDSIALAQEDLSMKVGDSIEPEFSFLPTNATQPVFVWTSLNEDVIKVRDGALHAVAPGVAKVELRPVVGDAVAELSVEVTAVALESLVLKSTEVELEMTRTLQLEVEFGPENATNKRLSWTSSDPSVVAVDENGLLTGLVEGVAEVVALAEDGGHRAVCQVKVIPVQVAGVVLESAEVKLLEMDNYQLTLSFLPEDAFDTRVTWSSSDEGIVSVSEDGLLTAHAIGTAFVEVTTMDGGFTAQCKVEVAEITSFIRTMFIPLSISSFNGNLYGQLGFAIFNESSQDILLTRMDVYDGYTGRLVSRTTNPDMLGVLEGHPTRGTTLTMNVNNLYRPIVVWTFEYQGVVYSVEDNYE